MLDDLSIRNKLVLLVALPILVVVMLAAQGGMANDRSHSRRRRSHGPSMAALGSRTVNARWVADFE